MIKKQKTLKTMWPNEGSTVVGGFDVVDLTDSPPIKTDKKRKRENSGLQMMSSKKPVQWVASAFGDFESFNSEQSCKPAKSKDRASSSNVCSTSQYNSAAGKDNKKFSGNQRPAVETSLWSDKYTPATKTDLAVHKNKILEVENWLSSHLNTKRQMPQIALLTGPAGAGKSATVKVLAKEMKCEIQEWINPVANTYDNSFKNTGLTSYSSDYSRVEGYSYESQLSQFEQFLLRANKYNTLDIFGDGSSTRKLILVEDFPNIFFRDASSFHLILRKYSKVGRCPLIFIISDSVNGESNERLLFPKDLQQQLHIENISINPVASTSMNKVLTKIATAESTQGVHKFTVPSKSVIESIAMSSAGDIRGAINALQFACLKDTHDLIPKCNEKGKKLLKKQSSQKTRGKKSSKSSADKDSELAAIGGRDTSLFLFRALGKILYCKRDSPEDHSNLPSLPPHLAEHERDPLIVNPEEVVEKCHLSGDYFNAYLHQNYLEFFSEIPDLTRATEYLSDSDFLTTEWNSRSALQHYSASVATRGLIHSNTGRAKCTSGGSGLGWKPLHKPQLYTTSKLARQNCDTARSLFKSYACTPEVLQTELLPYLSIINVTLHNPGQIAFLQEMSKFSSSKYPARSEKLDEKDVNIDENSQDNDEIKTQKSASLQRDDVELEASDEISNSQSKVVSSQGSDDEYTIDEYED